LTQELKPTDHLKRREWSDWWFEMATVNAEFSTKIIFSDEAHFHLSVFVSKYTEPYLGFSFAVLGRMRIQE
jgi:hypothetical protein